MKAEFHTSPINIVAKKQEIDLPSANSVFPIAGSAEFPLEQYLYRPYRWRNDSFYPVRMYEFQDAAFNT